MSLDRELWIVNQYAITPDLPGGTRHYDLATALARKGFRTKIFASDFNLALRKHTRLSARELYAVEQVADVKFVWIRAAGYKSNNWRRSVNMVTFAQNVMKVGTKFARSARPEVIVGSSPHPFAAAAALALAKRAKSRFFLELRDLWPQALVDMGAFRERHPAIRLMRFLERYLYAHAERIIVLARGSQEYLQERGIHAGKIVFVPNGVHLEHFRTRLTREEARKRYGFERFTILYTGAHGPANSLETILDAADILRLEPIEFVLVGDGPDKETLQRQAAARTLPNVRFLSPVPKKEIPDLLAATDVAVITLKNAKAFSYGISPNKLFDYMAAARPIVCSVPGEMARVVLEAGAGIVCSPEDPVAMAQAVRQLRQMTPQDRQEMGLRGRQHLERNFRREILVDQLVTAIDP